ncbi:XRN 5'-3' exonuclease N-terminus protein [Toxoplasma gondii MAS]|uniref:XRN 5'-3' exonuclease N-terminus protein n=1 Tax=Toxoplasma gondii MAS TaxID=943118 RepID=A0A086Q2H0_TOXGO|nr:XRN 5'-3' exonuclease N-terminus protein [Toxoplasma gondii MAS]
MFVSAMERHPCRRNKLVTGSYTWLPKEALPSIERVVDASLGRHSGAASVWQREKQVPPDSQSPNAETAESSLRSNGIEEKEKSESREDLPVLENFDASSLLRASSVEALRKKIIAAFFSLVSTVSRPSGVVEGKWTLKLSLGQRVAYTTQAGCIYQGSRGTVTGLCSIDGSVPFRLSGDTALQASVSVTSQACRQKARGRNGRKVEPWAWWEEAEVAAALQGILQDIVVEVLLDQVQLGAQNMDGRCSSLRLIRVPCIELFPLVSRVSARKIFLGAGTLPAPPEEEAFAHASRRFFADRLQSKDTITLIEK